MGLETQEWRGVACCEWPALPPKALVRSQSEVTEDHVWFCGYTVAGFHVDVWLLLPLENMVVFLVMAATRDHVGVQGICTTTPQCL